MLKIITYLIPKNKNGKKIRKFSSIDKPPNIKA